MKSLCSHLCLSVPLKSHEDFLSYNFTAVLDEITAVLLLLQGSAGEQQSHKLHAEKII